MGIASKINNKIAHFSPLRMATLYISMLFPKDEKLFLFGSWFGTKYADNAKYLYEYIINNRKDIRPVWMTSDDSVFEELHKRGLPVCKSGTFKGFQYAIHAGAVFYCTHNQEDIGIWESHFIGRAISMNLWHGIPLKKIMYDDEYNNLRDHPVKNAIRDAILSIPLKNSYLCSSSPAITEIYQRAFQMVKAHILEAGQPRNDYFILPHSNSLRSRYPNCKIIVYLPTHRNEGKTKIDFDMIFELADLNHMLEENGAVLVIKKHPYHRNDPRLGSDYSRIVELTEENFDTQELLDAADILVTDYSSCYIDYLFLDRPIIFYAYDYEKYMETDRQLYFDYDYATPGPKCKNYDEFRSELIMILDGEDNYKDKRTEIGKLFYGNNIGTLSSPRVIEAIDEKR